MNVIFGAGGFAKEIGWLIHELSKVTVGHRGVAAFVASDDAQNIGHRIQDTMVLAESDFFKQHFDTPMNVYIAVGSPVLRRRIYEKCKALLAHANFPALVHPSVLRDVRQNAITVGSGVIICAGTILTTDFRLDDFAQINLNCTIGHDSVIGAFCTISPGVHVSGGVNLGHSCFVGTGAVILENVRVPERTIIGAAATVVKTITETGTYVGTPARLKK